MGHCYKAIHLSRVVCVQNNGPWTLCLRASSANDSATNPGLNRASPKGHFNVTFNPGMCPFKSGPDGHPSKMQENSTFHSLFWGWRAQRGLSLPPGRICSGGVQSICSISVPFFFRFPLSKQTNRQESNAEQWLPGRMQCRIFPCGIQSLEFPLQNWPHLFGLSELHFS